MTTLKLVVRELLGLFFDDRFLTIAILTVVGLASGLALVFRVDALISGAALLFGCVLALTVSVWHAAGTSKSRNRDLASHR